MAGTDMPAADERPELADAARLAVKLLRRAVRSARSEDQPLRRVLLAHLGPGAAALPTVSDTCKLYEHVNLQAGMSAWLAADPRRQHELIGITGIPQIRFSDITIGDLVQAQQDSAYPNAGIGAPVTVNLPCGPDGQTMPCVTNGIYLVREDTDRLAIMIKPSGLGMRDTEVNIQVIGTSQDRVEEVLREIRALAIERSVFRGQVISFGPEVFGPAADSTPLAFLPRPSVRRNEIVLPDAAARRALLRLYQGNLDLGGVDLEPVIELTEGATAPFLRELLRKAALLAAEEDDGAPGADVPLRVTRAQLTAALDQLLSSRGQLTRVLLGGQR